MLCEYVSKASSTSKYGVTNLQSVDEFGHWDFLFRVVKDVQSLQFGIFGSVLEFDTNKVTELGSGTTEYLKGQSRSVIGCTLCQ